MRAIISSVGACVAVAMGLLGAAARGADAGALNKAVASASVVAIGRLDQYIPEPEMMDRMVEQDIRSSPVITGNPSAIVLETVQPRGTYVFSISSTLKGRPPQPLMVRLSRVMDRESWLTERRARLPLKANYLLVLTGDEKTGYSAAWQLPIPLPARTEGFKKPLDEASADAQFSALAGLFIAQLSDPAARQAAAEMLSQAVGDEVLAVMRPLSTDKDDRVRAAAIKCMAANGDLEAISLIGAWKNSNGSGLGNPLNLSLENFKTAAAIPYLNPLICDAPDSWTRINAIWALQRIPADSTSIPYLVKALRERENSDIAWVAYAMLHKLLPQLGASIPRAAPIRGGAQLPEAEIQRVEAWWADEQAGKHK